jgi:hypothetical protein
VKRLAATAGTGMRIDARVGYPMEIHPRPEQLIIVCGAQRSAPRSLGNRIVAGGSHPGRNGPERPLEETPLGRDDAPVSGRSAVRAQQQSHIVERYH